MININGSEWGILLVSPFHPSLRRIDGSYSIGCCDDLLKTIYISEDIGKYKFKKVLCHELVHAAMYSYNIYMSYEQEEMVADLIATYGQEIINITNVVYDKIEDCRKCYAET